MKKTIALTVCTIVATILFATTTNAANEVTSREQIGPIPPTFERYKEGVSAPKTDEEVRAENAYLDAETKAEKEMTMKVLKAVTVTADQASQMAEGRMLKILASYRRTSEISIVTASAILSFVFMCLYPIRKIRHKKTRILITVLCVLLTVQIGAAFSYYGLGDGRLRGMVVMILVAWGGIIAATKKMGWDKDPVPQTA